MSEPSTDELRYLVDKQRVHDLLARYCRGVDRVDRDMIASVFHPDGTCEFGALLLEGRDAIADAISKAAGGCILTFHMIGNHLVEFHGDVAASEAYYLSASTVEVDGSKQLRMRAGRYADRLERRDGEWKLKTRVVVEDWCKFMDLPLLPEGVSFRPGQQGTTDALYALLGSLADPVS
ncbi:nuclear transport factor 2 family protein [Flavisphingomonas formosensis]|uniref:nuclear transport factor 2 family protein n=1 Tax=Flavisphingomonas formosensis TaxID=861534 RepID=UPI0012F99247|nr:nuclear transport factor 2 family protein [Sphingomonas formosensis]